MVRVLGRVLEVFTTIFDVFAGAFHRMTAGVGEEAEEHEHAEH